MNIVPCIGIALLAAFASLPVSPPSNPAQKSGARPKRITRRIIHEALRQGREWDDKMWKEFRAADGGDRAALDRGLALMSDLHADPYAGMLLAQRLETAGRTTEAYDLSKRMIRKGFEGVGIQDVYAEHYLMAERRGDRDEMAYSIKRAKAIDAQDLFLIAAGAARQTNRQAEKAKWEKRAADAAKPDVR